MKERQIIRKKSYNKNNEARERERGAMGKCVTIS
jgi:hypothetical protein